MLRRGNFELIFAHQPHLQRKRDAERVMGLFTRGICNRRGFHWLEVMYCRSASDRIKPPTFCSTCSTVQNKRYDFWW